MPSQREGKWISHYVTNFALLLKLTLVTPCPGCQNFRLNLELEQIFLLPRIVKILTPKYHTSINTTHFARKTKKVILLSAPRGTCHMVYIIPGIDDTIDLKCSADPLKAVPSLRLVPYPRAILKLCPPM